MKRGRSETTTAEPSKRSRSLTPVWIPRAEDTRNPQEKLLAYKAWKRWKTREATAEQISNLRAREEAEATPVHSETISLTPDPDTTAPVVDRLEGIPYSVVNMDTLGDVPARIKNRTQLKEWVMIKTGGEGLPPEAWKALLAAHPSIKAKRKTTRKRKRTTRSRNYSNKRMAYGSGTRPIVMQPNIVGYGSYGLNSGGVFGLGEYNVRHNSLWNEDTILTGLGPPKVVNTHKGEAVIINHREYIGELVSGVFPNPMTPSTSFKLESYQLNPGNPILFPWLASIAAQFQEYEIRGMLVELKTEAADFSSTFAIGSTFMSADYNVLAADPTNKREVENMEYSSSTKPSNSLIMPIECHPSLDAQTHLYIAVNSDYNGGDRRLYDLCKIHIGTEGIPVENAKLAEIWITYEVALFKPKLSDAVPVIEGAHFTLSDCREDAVFNGATRQPQLYESTDIRVPSSLSLALPSASASWLITASWLVQFTESGNGEIQRMIFAPSDCEIIENTWAGPAGIDGDNRADPGAVFYEALTGSEVVRWGFNICVRVTGEAPTLTCLSLDWPSQASNDPIYGDLYVTRLPTGLVS